MPPNCEDIVVQRILVRHGFSRDLANLLLDDLRRSLDHFQTHPVSKPLTELEAGGFNHSGVHRRSTASEPRTQKSRKPGSGTSRTRKRR
jgi:hypothetical protein